MQYAILINSINANNNAISQLDSSFILHILVGCICRYHPMHWLNRTVFPTIIRIKIDQIQSLEITAAIICITIWLKIKAFLKYKAMFYLWKRKLIQSIRFNLIWRPKYYRFRIVLYTRPSSFYLQILLCTFGIPRSFLFVWYQGTKWHWHIIYVLT